MLLASQRWEIRGKRCLRTFISTNVATEIEIGQKMNTKNLRLLKMDEDEYKESSLIQKFFEDSKFFEYLQRYEDFQRKMKNFC